MTAGDDETQVVVAIHSMSWKDSKGLSQQDLLRAVSIEKDKYFYVSSLLAWINI